MTIFASLNAGKPQGGDLADISIIAGRLDNIENGLLGVTTLDSVSITGGSIINAVVGISTNPVSVYSNTTQTDNILIDGNTISSTDTNGNINITPNGTGSVLISDAKATNLRAGGTNTTTYPKFRVVKETITWTGSLSHTGTNSVLVKTIDDKKQIIDMNLTSWHLTTSGSTDSTNTKVWLTVELADATNQYNSGDTGIDSTAATYTVGDYTSAKNVYFNITSTLTGGTRTVDSVIFDLYYIDVNV